MRTRSVAIVFLLVGVCITAVHVSLSVSASSRAADLEARQPSGKKSAATVTVPDPIPVSFTSQTSGVSEIHPTGRVEGCELFAAMVPDQMVLVGDVITRETGDITLGVSPTSTSPSDWGGGSATAGIYIGDIVSSTVGILTVSWPDWDGKGIYSPLRGQVATISLDGNLLWAKRTLEQSTSGYYHAAEHRPVMVTFVVTQAITHTLTFSVPAQTAWDISQVTIHLCPMPSAIRGLAYSPFRDCQTPHWGDLYPSIDEIREDMPLLFHSANAVRTYSSLNTIGQIPALAHEWGLRVSAGAWLGQEVDEDGNPVLNKNSEEISGVIAIANTVPVESVIVGNEVLLRGDLPITQLITYINHVRANIPPTVEVTTAEIWPIWMGGDGRYPKEQVDELVDRVDYILMHSHPYWTHVSVDEAATRVISEYKALQRAYPDKRIVIGETGWPTGGETNDAALPSIENQLRFFTKFLYLAEREGIEFYYFDPFDELWKRWPSREEGGEGEAGAHWGLGYADRTAKHVLQGVLLPGSFLFPHRVYLPLILKDGEGESMSMFTWFPVSSLSASDRTIASSTIITFPVYTEWIALDNHFIPSGWMGDLDSIDFYECEREDPHSGELAIRVRYAATGTLGWAGIYWQEPENNWGDLPGGYDLTGASRLTFWVRGEEGGEVVEFLVGGIGESTDPYSDTLQPARSTGPIVLSDVWEQVEIDLAGADLRRVIGGFAWVANRCYNSESITFYLDDIVFDFDPEPESLPPPTRMPFYVYDDVDSTCNHFVPSGWMGDTGDIGFNDAYTETACSGATAMRVSYSARGYGPSYGCESYGPPCWWAGVYWQEPENNWGDLSGGYDLTGASRLTFWARGEEAGEVVEFLVGGIGESTDSYSDTLQPARSTGPIVLSDTWEQVEIDLAGANLRRVIGGFAWVANRCYNSESITFYLDDIVFDFDPEPESLPPPTRMPFYVYDDVDSTCNHFVPSGWMGDTGDIGFDDAYTETTCSGATAVRVSYSARGYGPSYGCESYRPPCWWAGIYWQEPENNWGTVPNAGFDLSAYNKLVFCAKGDVGGERIEFGMGGLGRDADTCDPVARYPDSTCKVSKWETLTTEWREYTIHLGGQDLSYIIGGFLWATNRDSNPSGAAFYLDEIRFLRE